MVAATVPQAASKERKSCAFALLRSSLPALSGQLGVKRLCGSPGFALFRLAPARWSQGIGRCPCAPKGGTPAHALRPGRFLDPRDRKKLRSPKPQATSASISRLEYRPFRRQERRNMASNPQGPKRSLKRVFSQICPNPALKATPHPPLSPSYPKIHPFSNPQNTLQKDAWNARKVLAGAAFSLSCFPPLRAPLFDPVTECSRNGQKSPSPRMRRFRTRNSALYVARPNRK